MAASPAGEPAGDAATRVATDVLQRSRLLRDVLAEATTESPGDGGEDDMFSTCRGGTVVYSPPGYLRSWLEHVTTPSSIEAATVAQLLFALQVCRANTCHTPFLRSPWHPFVSVTKRSAHYWVHVSLHPIYVFRGTSCSVPHNLGAIDASVLFHSRFRSELNSAFHIMLHRRLLYS